ncbi:hypothetical protein FHG87_013966 [Trinorchestia longiramus]|nr:hypothetical protein FHG87_013966 [Trinorchestia longiramus]
MSLREQQVMHLYKEISHAAGVRLTLRHNDCINSIAFVNCFSQVYVAGWKQREHPYLHNTFHLGDRVVSIGGASFSTASAAHSLIRSDSAIPDSVC